MAQNTARKAGVKQPADHKVSTSKAANADRLDDETTETFSFEFENIEFVVPNIARGRKWRETAEMLASLNGEMGVMSMQNSLDELLGDQMEETEDWDFTQLMRFGYKLGERLGEAIGTPGK